MQTDVLDEEGLSSFLDLFYAKVRRDPLLAPVFATRIAEPDWPRHLETIRSFWSSVLFKTGRYRGNPFGKHLGLDGIGPRHFERWLGLFAEAAEERFAPEVARMLTDRAGRIGDSLEAGLFFQPGPGRRRAEDAAPSVLSTAGMRISG